ncbi:hypothetical protein J2808_000200 [Pseudarthrobacter sulfonivorans]|nr:hypothetical protein [Pseudarthrobacter sulfonivorans]
MYALMPEVCHLTSALGIAGVLGAMWLIPLSGGSAGQSLPRRSPSDAKSRRPEA